LPPQSKIRYDVSEPVTVAQCAFTLIIDPRKSSGKPQKGAYAVTVGLRAEVTGWLFPRGYPDDGRVPQALHRGRNEGIPSRAFMYNEGQPRKMSRLIITIFFYII
jgi:hypothetical protein